MADAVAEKTDLIEIDFPPMPAPVEVKQKINEAFADIYKKIEGEITAHNPDISTEKGRKEIASLAYKISRTKTGLDKAAVELTEGQKKIIDAVNEERREMKAKLDGYKDQARKPLTEWEQAEDERLNNFQALRETLKSNMMLEPNISKESVQVRLDWFNSVEIDPKICLEYTVDMEKIRTDGIAAMELKLSDMEREEAQRAELEALRAEKEERERKEREAEEARLQAEREREAEERHKAEEERIAQEAREQAQREAEERERLAQQEAEELRIKAKREADERVAAAELEAEEAKRRADEAEKAASEAERRRTERMQEEARQLKEAEQRANEKRIADEKHRASVSDAATEAIMAITDVDFEVALILFHAISKGQVPHVTVNY